MVTANDRCHGNGRYLRHYGADGRRWCKL